METQKTTNPALAALAKLQAGFWLSDKELKETVNYLESQDRRLSALQEENDKLKSVLNIFAKIGAKIDYPLDVPLIDFGNLEVTYADMVRCADVLYGKDRAAKDG